MSYDLMVFEITKAPKTKKEFMDWYDRQTEWAEEHDYETVGVTSPALQKWFMEMKDTFPPMNGKFAPEEEDIANDEDLESRLTDYSIGYNVIYAAFSWSVADEAYEKVRTLNKQYKTDYKEYKNKGKRGIVNKFLHVFLLCVIHYSVVSRKLCDDNYRQR